MKPSFSHLLSPEYNWHPCIKHNWSKQATKLYHITPHLLFTSYFSHKPFRWAIKYGSKSQSIWRTFVKRGNWLEKQNGQTNVGSTLCVPCFLCVYQWNLISTEQKPVGFVWEHINILVGFVYRNISVWWPRFFTDLIKYRIIIHA